MPLRKFGRYEIRSDKIGTGAMALVYRAYDPESDREVALKVLPPGYMQDQSLYQRFKQESKIMARMGHPHIVPVYDVGEEEGQPYMVMRYMTGGTLADRIQRGALSLAETAHILAQLAPALDAVHRQGAIHRDIKPTNILFDEYDQAYLSDFGIAKLNAGVSMTRTGTAVGTAAYMSPEQAAGETESQERKLDSRSDIYSLGVVVYEMLIGQLPYQATSQYGLMVKHISAPIPRIRHIRRDLPASCQAVVDKALAKRPEDRYQTAAELAAVVNKLAQEPPTVRSLRPWFWAGGILAGVVLVAVILWLSSQILAGSPNQPTPTPTVSATLTATPTPRPPDPTATATLLPTQTPRPTLVSPTATPPPSPNATPTLRPTPTLAASPTTAAIINTAAPTRAPSPTNTLPTATAVSPTSPPPPPPPPTQSATSPPAPTPTSPPTPANTPTSTPAS
ncbi:MAG: serine/threonine-protein kinase [Chloroflexota bacterium]